MTEGKVSPDLPDSARVVIIGGGIIGCSLAYHLSKFGMHDVVLLERRQLTCGTTWHSAGQVGQLRASYNLTKLAQYTAELLPSLEAETGQATGFKPVGSIGFATTEGRYKELRRIASLAKPIGIEAEFLSGEEIKRKWPIINDEGILGGIFTPGDGYTNPVDTTMALAKGAKMRGATILENVKVTAILKDGDRVCGVKTDHGTIDAEIVVNCAGMWGREVGAMAGASVPLQACEHFYMVTEADDRFSQSPSVRDWDAHVYFKSEPGKLLFGFFEHEAKVWGERGIPDSFCFDELPEDYDHVMPYLEAAIHRVPMLAEVGIQKFFNGPESFTPDVRYLMGETPEMKNFFVACGFNSIGVLSSGGAGKVLAEWILEGRPPMDLADVDIRRMHPFQGNHRYIIDRASESLGLLYATHWPFRQPESARGVRQSPFHDRLKELGACFGEVAGWERPNWFAATPQEARYEYSFDRQNWFENSAAEHKAIREGCGLIDLSSFAKFLVQGRDAEAVLQQICAADIAVPVGRIVYSQWLNDRGGIESDLTIIRRAETEFLVITGGGVATRDFNWLTRHIPDDAHCFATDVSSGYASLGIMGPRSREVLSTVTHVDLTNDGFPFGAVKNIDLGYAKLLAARISYVGELGWELHIPTEFAAHVFDEIWEKGAPLGLTPVGMHAVDSCRMEKAFRHWGHDITDEDSPLEAGLGFACAFDKPSGFIGKSALEGQKKAGLAKRLVQFALEDPGPLLYHHEPIYRDGLLVGYIRSGAYGHHLGCAVGLGYIDVPAGTSSIPDYVRSGSYEVEVEGHLYTARASLSPLYDPKGERMRR